MLQTIHRVIFSHLRPNQSATQQVAMQRSGNWKTSLQIAIQASNIVFLFISHNSLMFPLGITEKTSSAFTHTFCTSLGRIYRASFVLCNIELRELFRLKYLIEIFDLQRKENDHINFDINLSFVHSRRPFK